MHKLSLLLGVTAIALTIACVHLYREVQAERSRADQAVAALQRVDAAAGQPAVSSAAPVAKETGSVPQVPDPRALQRSTQEQRPTQEPSASTRSDRREQRRAEMLQRWSNPEFRARALLNAKSEVRNWHPDVGSALGLSAEEETAFIDLLARQRLQISETNEPMRFAADAERKEIQDRVNALSEQHSQELAQFLGPRYGEFSQYLREVPERREVRTLRSRLDETNALSPSQSSRLVSAMYEERDSYLQQMETVENYGGYSLQYPIEASPKLGDAQARLQFAEEQVGRTQEFMSRVRMRASQILSAEQLRRFDEMQEEQRASQQRRLQRVRNQANRPQQPRRRTQ
jgi:hypothetical protein